MCKTMRSLLVMLYNIRCTHCTLKLRCSRQYITDYWLWFRKGCEKDEIVWEISKISVKWTFERLEREWNRHVRFTSGHFGSFQRFIVDRRNHVQIDNWLVENLIPKFQNPKWPWLGRLNQWYRSIGQNSRIQSSLIGVIRAPLSSVRSW